MLVIGKFINFRDSIGDRKKIPAVTVSYETLPFFFSHKVPLYLNLFISYKIRTKLLCEKQGTLILVRSSFFWVDGRDVVRERFG